MVYLVNIRDYKKKWFGFYLVIFHKILWLRGLILSKVKQNYKDLLVDYYFSSINDWYNLIILS